MIDHVLAVAPVSDLARACRFYEQLFGRAPDNRPMTTLAEWRITETAWLQVFCNPDQAGSAFVNFAVGDLATWLVEIESRGLDPGEVRDANKGVQLSAIADPDGNMITFIGNFRIEY
jgi:catechol 2,3-dioxygenase-like lactoylglutathione lyase family enzyme